MKSDKLAHLRTFLPGLLGLLMVASASLILAAPLAAAPKGLTLSPLRHELESAPGTSQDGSLTVTNSTDASMRIRLNAEEFSVITQQYDYAFTVESNVAKWVTFSSDEVELAVGESRQVSFTIGVPLSAEPGGRYVSLFASTDADIQGGGVNSQQRIASLIYLTVLGDVSRAGHLLSLSSPGLIGGASQWSIALQNTGTTHYRSRYNVNVQNIFGNHVVASMSGDALILPGTVRLVSDVLPLPPLPGLYKAVYTIGLGDSPAAIETRLVVYMPPAATALVSITGILTTLVFLRRRSRTS